MTFQSSPDPKAGCYFYPPSCNATQLKFQSSPDPKAGCYLFPHLRHELPEWSFNPHPTRRPGATLDGPAGMFDKAVGFNPHPTRRPGATLGNRPQRRVYGVSILTRPEGRVLLPHLRHELPEWRFQSSPDPKAGCYMARRHRRNGSRRVSILTRPEGRVLRLSGTTSGRPQLFQSSPDPKAGCYDEVFDAPVVVEEFQSSPDPKAGCYPSVTVVSALSTVFQSSPDPKAGCYGPDRLRPPGHNRFQSSPDPKAGCYHASGYVANAWLRVSILTRPEGRVLRHLAKQSLTPTKFQSSPDPKAGCYRDHYLQVRASTLRFNPHPTRRPGATTASPTKSGGRASFNPHPTRRPGATTVFASLSC